MLISAPGAHQLSAPPFSLLQGFGHRSRSTPVLPTALLPYLTVTQSFACKRLPLLQAFGRTGSGAPVLDALAGLANRLLTADASEVDLHTAVCMRLLPVLVGRRRRCLRLVQLDHWQQLAGGGLVVVLPDLGYLVDLHTAVCLCMLLVPLGLHSRVSMPCAPALLAAAGRWGARCCT